MWIYANPNPCRSEEADCVVRAICIATGTPWRRIHRELCDLSRDLCSMPSINWVWGAYLTGLGWKKESADGTVRDFAEAHPEGTYILGTGQHAVAVSRGNWIDTWDSGDEQILYYFRKRGRNNGI